ncbi:MOP flippase family protein [Maioricimonas sp. JC845]|uniref:MOP flippase family protein n=1 Tax=Maioricimonas sp. JC845 TaxID=3232138 RepID=UPI0034587983
MATTTDNPKPGKKPKEDFYSSVRWSAFSKYGAQGMQFVISMVLARLLAPEYFGLLGMATVITGFVKVFKNLGFSSAIVQRKNVSDNLLSTLFWVNLGVCLLVAAVVLGIAPLAAWMYDDPRVMPIVAVLSINFVFAGFTMIPAALLQRRMEFKKLAIREIGGVLAAGLTAIPLAWMGWGVWALVGSSLAGSFAQMILINLAVPFRPRMVYDRQGLSECLKFGLNLTGFNIFNYFARNSDNLVIGLFLGPVALGFYSLAYKLMLLPRDSVSKVLSRVLFPKLSKLQDDDERLADVYLRATGAIAFVTFPMMAGLAVLAEPFVQVVLGEKWLPAVPLIQLLAPVGALQSIGSVSGQLYMSRGETPKLFVMGVISGVVRSVGFVIGVIWGVQGVTVSYVITAVVLFYANHWNAFSFIGPLTIRRLNGELGRPLPALAAMLIVSVAITVLVPLEHIALGVAAVLAPATYIGVAFASRVPALEAVESLLRRQPRAQLSPRS